MPRGQRNTHNNNHHHHHHSHHKKRQLPVHYNSAPLPPREPPQLYHETPHNYLTAITKTTTPQHHLHHLHHTKKLPTSHLHETIGQLLEADDVFSSSSSSEVAETAASAAVDTEDGDHMQYLADNFALFPQPSTSTTYETELIPHSNSHSFVAHREEADEEDNEISGPGDGSHDTELIMMEEEEAENYPRHAAYAERFTSPSKTMKNEQQLLQQIYQQQQEQHQQQHNQFEQQADSMKTAKLRGNKYKKAEKEYYSEDDMTANMMMYSSMPHTTTTTMTTFAKGNNAKVDHSDNGGFKALTVDDIWSQLQRQYLNKYVPQAQPLSEGSFGDGDDGHNEGGDDISLKSTPKRKRTIIRQKPKSSSSSSSASRQPTSSFWPAKSLNYDNNNHQPQNHDDNHSFHSYSTSPTLSSSPYPSTSSRNTELFDDTRAFRRPYNKFNGHNTAAAHHTHVVANEDDDDVRIQFNTDNVDDVDDDNDSSSHHHHHHQHRDASSFEENVYQRGKKYVGNTGHVAYGNSNVNNPFNYQDLYGAFSTPITATVATKVHPSTYHPKLTRASTFSSSPSSFYGDSVSPTLSHESTSYQWHTQQHNPDSYQTYHSHHQKQQQQDTHQQQHHEEQQHLQHSHPHQNQHHRFHQFQPPQSSALRLPKATITIMPSTASTAISSTFASSLSPTMSNEFTSSPATKTNQQTSRYKKRKNRIKTKKNRIVVV